MVVYLAIIIMIYVGSVILVEEIYYQFIRQITKPMKPRLYVIHQMADVICTHIPAQRNGTHAEKKLRMQQHMHK